MQVDYSNEKKEKGRRYFYKNKQTQQKQRQKVNFSYTPLTFLCITELFFYFIL